MSETLKVVVDRPDATVAVLRTDGYINNTGGEEIAKEAYALLGSGVNRLLLDLEETKIVNSIGISFLTQAPEEPRCPCGPPTAGPVRMRRSQPPALGPRGPRGARGELRPGHGSPVRNGR